ncbi:MAG: protein kinase [Anaerolineae bacterium]|nr:protein kinase [Anaerolineae bacterium]
MSDTLTGRTIGKYQILDKLGRGGMAEVYKAYQENLDRYVAIKLMHAFLANEQDFLQRFKREARAMAAMNHPNIVGVYDFDVYKEDTYFLVMEYIAGGTLKQRIEELAEKQEGMPLGKSVQIAYQVAEALDYAHNRGMVHRDVKPANIMLGEDDKALLTDFGIVKMMGGQTMAYTVTGALIGTPSYMSPEQAMGKPGDKRVDIYALGILLFQMTTGQLPYTADTPLAVIMKHVNETPPAPVMFNPDVPLGLQDIILKAMEKDPENRYQTAGDMAKDLRALKQSSAQTAAILAGTTAVIPKLEPATQTPEDTEERTAAAMTAAAALYDAPHGNTPTFQSIPLPKQPTAAPPAEPVPVPAPVEKKRAPWLYVGIILLVLILLGGTAVIFANFNGNKDEAEAVVMTTEEPTETPTDTPQPDDTPDTEATISAAIMLTEESRPTEKATKEPPATPTKKPTPTPKPTVNLTETFLEACVFDVTLENTYTYQNENFDAAPTGKTFPVNWVLTNSGTCPWPETVVWAFGDGETFGFDDDPIPVQALAAGEQTTITTDFIAPTRTGSFKSTWQLIDTTSGDTIGTPIDFTLKTYIDATATPTPSKTPATPPTAAVTATTAVEQPLDLIYVIQSCEYIGTEYRCRVQITPYGGGGGPYTVFVFDADQPAEYRDPFPIYHFAKSRRCASYNQEVKAIDDATGTSISKQIYIDPNNYIPGGCTLP